MNKKTTRIIAIIIAALMVFGVCATIFAELAYAETLEQKIDKQEEKKKDAQRKLEAARSKKEKSLAAREQLEKEAGDLQARINTIDARIADTSASLAKEEIKLQEATEKADKQYELFQERFRIMCEHGDVSYIEMLFSAKNFADFADKAEVMQEISEYDKKIFDKMESFRKTIEESRDSIADMKKSQEADKAALSSEKQALSRKLQEQKDYIRELESDSAAYQKVIDEADRAMESLKRQISSSLSTESRGTKYVGGEFAWPTPSCYIITSQFSPRRKNPVSGIYKRHTGTDIGAQYGAQIIAANSGTVTLAGWNSGYGNCVIIDHGGGRATLYGHMSSYSVSAGQKVSKGQEIGRVGSTGNSTGPHLHFEILINGSAVNPMQYF